MASKLPLTVTIHVMTTDRAYFARCDQMGWMFGVLLEDLLREYGEGWTPDDSQPWTPDDSRDV